MEAKPWKQRPVSEMAVSRVEAEAVATTLTRLETRMLLEAALELRNPRLILKKPTLNGAPADLYALHQAVLRFGGYRQVRASEKPPAARGMRRLQARDSCCVSP